MIDNLRELVRAVLLEDLSKLKNWALQSYNPIERELAKLDIIPVGRGDRGDSQLGAGLFNTVHEVMYKGKRAAARYSVRREELENLLMFLTYRDRLPSQYRKHFPKLYTTFDFKIHGIPYYGAVVELLEPMPAALEFDIDIMSLNNNLQRSRVNIVSQSSVIKKLLPKNTSPEVTKQLLAFFQKELKPTLNRLIGQPLTVVDDELVALADSQNEEVYNKFIYAVFRALRDEVIPSGADSRSADALAPQHPSKAVRDFYKFINALKAEKLQVEDLHTGNFMIRPGTGDFVVVDPGLFKPSESIEYEPF
jgi:hypothetical protein